MTVKKKIFGIKYKGSILTPNEYWLMHKNNFLTVLTGIFYLCWVPVPLVFAGWFYFKNKEQFFYFSLTFLFVNVIGFSLYYLYPAAPPWYIQQYGFVLQTQVPGNTAGLEKFDEIVHAGIFKSLYAQSSNVFAAMPSLHAAYPLLVLYYGIQNKLGIINILFAVIMLGIWFSSVYNSHHYVLDVLAGMVCGGCAIILFPLLVNNIQWVRHRFNILVDSVK